MNIIPMLVFAIITIILAAIIKEYRPEFTALIIMMSGIIFFTYICSGVINIFDYFRDLCNYVGIDIVYIEVMFKIIGISYMSEFVSSLCKDAGQSSVAVKVDIVGKLVVLSVSLPIFKELLNLIVNIIT